MSDTKNRIRRHVTERPGTHFNQLGRDLDLANGQVQYHLRKLRREGEIVAEEICGQTHYFDPEFGPWERVTVAFLRRETPREIILRLHADGPTQPTTLASELDLARSTIAWHVSNLEEHDVVRKSTARPVTIELARPDRTAELLDAVSESLPNRIVDRFVRTVDQLFE